MKERPILFSGGMVRAILDSRKSQTRRVVKPQPTEAYVGNGNWLWKGRVLVYGVPDPSWRKECVATETALLCPYGQPGDRLWVRETWAAFTKMNYEYGDCDEIECAPAEMPDIHGTDAGDVVYKANETNFPDRWRPSIHMPRWASRITLEITGVRVERLQNISVSDCWDEGVEPEKTGPGEYHIKSVYERLWDHINAKKYPWSSNPWVWCISFRRLP